MHRVTMVVIWVCVVVCIHHGCAQRLALEDQFGKEADDLKIDPATGVPYASVFQFPISGFDTSDFGFRWGNENDAFCLESSGGQCVAYGYHLARDTKVKKTPIGTAVFAPADGIVRLTTDKSYGGYGSDSKSNPEYKGCLILLEHEFPNGQAVTTLLGHLQCESNVTYSVEQKMGNPVTGEIVHRGQYLGHVNHYWSGASKNVDWHHLHWGMRKGKFDPGNIGPYIRGYAKKNEFTIDPVTNAWTHPEWVDPFTIVAANGDHALSASAEVRHHPPGTLLQDGNGGYWFVQTDMMIASVPLTVMASDRFNVASAIRVSDAELACYAIANPVASYGHVTLYKRPNSSTIVMTYDAEHVRYDVIRWEALLSWGYDAADLTTNASTIQKLEATYAPKGMRLLRPGTLVKADESSEVSIVTPTQTRRAIASAEVFEALGFGWERVVSVPGAVIDQVAGAKENALVDHASMLACGMMQKQPEMPSGNVHLVYSGQPIPGLTKLEGWWQPPNGPAHGWGPISECVDTIPNDGKLDCTFNLPIGTSPFEFQINLPNGGFWGDQSCGTLGGCGKPNGTVTMTTQQGALVITMVPNNPNNAPYYNGHVQLVK